MGKEKEMSEIKELSFERAKENQSFKLKLFDQRKKKIIKRKR